MQRRWPVIFTVFLIGFVAAFAGAYSWRSSQDDSADTIPVETATTAVATTTTTPPDTSLLALPTTVPETSVVETTTAPSVPQTTEAPPRPATTERPVEPDIPDLSADGALLRPPADGDRRQLDPNGGCASLMPNNVTADDCGRFTSNGGDAAWVQYQTDGGFVVEVLTPEDAASAIWPVRLRTDVNPARMTVRTDTGLADLVLGARRSDADRTLKVDVVDGGAAGPAVSLHLDLVAGRASVGGTALDAWNGVYRGNDSPGQPSRYDHWTIQRQDGGWTVAAASMVDASQVGAGNL